VVTKLAAALLLLAAATALHADVTPQGPPPVVGTTGIIGPYTVELVSLETGRDGVLRVRMRVTKKDPVHGELQLVQLLTAGESLGAAPGTLPDTGDPRTQSKLHVAMSKDPKLSFDPQVTIVSMKQHPDWVVRWCNLVKLPDGFGCVELEKRRVPVRVNEVVFQRTGKWKFTLRNTNSMAKMPTDETCTVHGGRILARSLDAAETMDAKAAFQLARADEDWKSRSPKVRRRAQEAYLKLLKDFASTPVVSSNLDRIKTRSEEAIDE